ncbi:MAG: DUF533 domain-containing protein [Candidatus Electrothrix sp. YB6]
MDVEKLLGKLLHEVTGSGGAQFARKYNEYSKGGKKKKYKKYKKKYKGKDAYYGQSGSSHRSAHKGSLLGQLTGNLKSGKGLLTAIGLGVGAYEIYRSKQQAQQPQAGTVPAYTPPPAAGQFSTPPPPPPPQQAPVGQPQNAPGSAVPPSASTQQQQAGGPAPLATGLNEQEVARRLVQVMIGAAHADGILDGDEEKAILDRLRDADLAQEEKMFLLDELHRPRSIAELTEGIEDTRLAQAMYAVAASAVVIDTESERMWFDELGEALSLSPEVRQFIEETL